MDRRKVALVTGGGRGIGAAVCRALATEGYAVAVCDVAVAEAEQVAGGLTGLPGGARAYAVDVTDYQSLGRTVGQVEDRWGGIDLLVNNAGVNRVASLEDTTEEIWDFILDVNLKGAFLASKAVVPGMKARHAGCIVNMSSRSGRKGSAFLSAYSAAKFGLVGLTQSMALELAPHGIRVNAVCPGVIATPMWEALARQYSPYQGKPASEVWQDMIAKIPQRRPQTVEEVAAAVCFLASASAAAITGIALDVSGGAGL